MNNTNSLSISSLHLLLSAALPVLTSAAATALTLPTQYSELPLAARIAIEELEGYYPAYSGVWQTKTTGENTTSGYHSWHLPEYVRELYFGIHTMGGYLTLTERDIVGDERPEHIYQIVVSSEAVDAPQPAYVFSPEGQFLYAIPQTMLKGKKNSTSFRGELILGNHWWQWELTEEYARRIEWFIPEEEADSERKNNKIQTVTAADHLYQGFCHSCTKYCLATTEYGDTTKLNMCQKRMQELNNAWDLQPRQSNAPQMTIHVTSVAECILEPTMTWRTFSDTTSPTEAALKWNEVSAEQLKTAENYNHRELRQKIRSMSPGLKSNKTLTGMENCFPLFPPTIKTDTRWHN